MDSRVAAAGILGPGRGDIVTTLNSKKTAVQFNPALHAVGELKTEGGKVAALVKDLQTVQLRRRLDNPHNAEWTVKDPKWTVTA